MNAEKIIPFMKYRLVATVISSIVVVASIVSLFVNGLNFGLDFTGGTLVELNYQNSADLSSIRGKLAEEGYEGAIVINFGADTDVLIRLQQTEALQANSVEGDLNENAEKTSLGDVIHNLLQDQVGEDIELKRVEVVGAQVGDELRDDGGLGMLFALAVVMVYVALRFQFKFSVGAVVALAHDVIIVLGFFSLFKINFDLTVLAAILAVIGYSLNDTIVVADRIRENFRMIRKGTSEEIINISTTQTLDRTLITSFTTLLVLFALFFVGGELIHNFATALIIGIVVGTYSSIYVAANVLLTMNITKDDLMPVEKEGAELDELP